MEHFIGMVIEQVADVAPALEDITIATMGVPDTVDMDPGVLVRFADYSVELIQQAEYVEGDLPRNNALCATFFRVIQQRVNDGYLDAPALEEFVEKWTEANRLGEEYALSARSLSASITAFLPDGLTDAEKDVIITENKKLTFLRMNYNRAIIHLSDAMHTLPLQRQA